MDQYESMRILVVRKATDTLYSCFEVTASATMAWHLHKNVKGSISALAGVAQWIEHQPANQRVAHSIPSQGTCLGCGPGPQ